MQTCSDSISASIIARNAGMTRSNESGKLIPSRRGQESHVAACGSHSAGMRYSRAAGVSHCIADSNVQRPTLNVQRSVAEGNRCQTVRPSPQKHEDVHGDEYHNELLHGLG